MSVIAVGLAFLTTALDGRLELPSFIGSWAAGLDAGLILSTIAGSMITVAALVFSITMLVLTSREDSEGTVAELTSAVSGQKECARLLGRLASP